jgi:RimJ/RimL family protein N-acetyltransferase
MTVNDFSFKPLEEKDLDQLCLWLNKPHIKEWWDESLTEAETKAKYSKRIRDDFVHLYIVSMNGKPLGVVQHYDVSKIGGGLWPDEDEGTVGIDLFIGETEKIERGIGTEMVKAFLTKLFADSEIKKIITDVNPLNSRAIRVYEKVGFNYVKDVATPDGTASLFAIIKN